MSRDITGRPRPDSHSKGNRIARKFRLAENLRRVQASLDRIIPALEALKAEEAP